MTEGELEMIREAVQLLPKGWCIVPLEPTQDMLLQGCKAGLSTGVLLDDTRFSCERAVWKAMLEHSPNRKL